MDPKYIAKILPSIQPTEIDKYCFTEETLNFWKQNFPNLVETPWETFKNFFKYQIMMPVFKFSDNEAENTLSSIRKNLVINEKVNFISFGNLFMDENSFYTILEQHKNTPPQNQGYPPQNQMPMYPQNQGYPQNQSYPPQNQGYPPQNQMPIYPPQDQGYPPQNQIPSYPPQDQGYPPQNPSYPPQNQGYPPQNQMPMYPQQNQGYSPQNQMPPYGQTPQYNPSYDPPPYDQYNPSFGGNMPPMNTPFQPNAPPMESPQPNDLEWDSGRMGKIFQLSGMNKTFSTGKIKLEKKKFLMFSFSKIKNSFRIFFDIKEPAMYLGAVFSREM